jgi:hypothetical protein
MPTINRQELDRLDRRGLQLTIFSAVFVLILAGGLAAHVSLVFVHPKAIRGRCAQPSWALRYHRASLSHISSTASAPSPKSGPATAELERNVELQIRPVPISQNPCLTRIISGSPHHGIPPRLTMEKTLSLVLVKVKPGARASQNDQNAGLSDAAKSMSSAFAPPIPSIAWPTISSASCFRNRHPQRQAHRISIARGTASRSLALWQLI